MVLCPKDCHRGQARKYFWALQYLLEIKKVFSHIPMIWVVLTVFSDSLNL